MERRESGCRTAQSHNDRPTKKSSIILHTCIRWRWFLWGWRRRWRVWWGLDRGLDTFKHIPRPRDLRSKLACFYRGVLVTHIPPVNNIELTSLNEELQQRLFDSEFNLMYHDELGRLIWKLDLGVRMSLACAATVVTVCGSLLVMPEHPKVWPTIAGAISLISTSVIPLLKWNKLIPRIESERLRWIQLKNEYENLWNDSQSSGDWDGATRELKKLRKKDIMAEKSGGIIPKYEWLIEKCTKQVIMAHTRK